MGNSSALEQIVHGFEELGGNLREKFSHLKRWYITAPLAIASIGALYFLTPVHDIPDKITEGLYEAEIARSYRAVDNKLSASNEMEYISRLELWEQKAIDVLESVHSKPLDYETAIRKTDAQILDAMALLEQGMEKGYTQGMLHWDTKIALFDELIEYRKFVSINDKDKPFRWIADDITETLGTVIRYLQEYIDTFNIKN